MAWIRYHPLCRSPFCCWWRQKTDWKMGHPHKARPHLFGFFLGDFSVALNHFQKFNSTFTIMGFKYSLSYVIHTAPISSSFHMNRPASVSQIATLKLKFFLNAKFEIKKKNYFQNYRREREWMPLETGDDWTLKEDVLRSDRWWRRTNKRKIQVLIYSEMFCRFLWNNLWIMNEDVGN